MRARSLAAAGFHLKGGLHAGRAAGLPEGASMKSDAATVARNACSIAPTCAHSGAVSRLVGARFNEPRAGQTDGMLRRNASVRVVGE
jgi:hypothetical protein